MADDAVSPAEGWNHNSHYHRLLLAAVPRPCPRALDVGCGLGGFARELARIAGHVEALDREPDVLRRACELSAGIDNLQFLEADFLTWETASDFDFVSFVATLHHLPFEAAMAKAAGLLRPGGVIAVLGLDRAPSWIEEVARSLIAYPVSHFYRSTRRTAPVGAPIVEPTMTLDEIRGRAGLMLPGSIVRRHLLWRYSLVWTKT